MHKQRGQMTIFIAFIFQVLFVFFAMTINVGMVVHDKINLQNSVDLAAFYGAQKQAEILNVIAHTNYQIRQSWKLLSWRIRAMGDATRSSHPAQGNPLVRFGGQDVAWPGAAGELGICVTSEAWTYPGSEEHICAAGGSNIRITEFPDLAVPPTPFTPWDAITRSLLRQWAAEFRTTCQGMGQYNWYMAVRWIAEYRTSVGNRQRIIKKLAEYLRDFKDIQGESIEEGMLATLRANLTRANLESLGGESGGFQVFNSMADIPQEDWLPQVKILPYIPYTDIYEARGCKGEVKHVFSPPRSGGVSQQIISAVERYTAEPPAGGDTDYHSSKGVEKNPWFMVYTGAKVNTFPRKPFFPFGSPIELKARAFAQPFGGRIGPWSKQFWLREKGHAQSGDIIDELLPPFATSYQGGGVLDARSIPNYSRFPKDSLGLKSSPTLATLNLAKGPQKLNVKVYDHMPDEVEIDPLAKKDPKTGSDWQRKFEIAAVSPDVFDIHYYSIQPKFYEMYLTKMQNFFSPQLPMNLDYGSDAETKFNVLQQIEMAKSFPVFQQAYFVVNDWQHLLTSWAPSGTFEYDFPVDRFGKCPILPGNITPTDSNCVAGGRAGYSVKIVAKNYLESTELALGGDPSVKGPLFNPPTGF